jgi:hypothetical protein
VRGDLISFLNAKVEVGTGPNHLSFGITAMFDSIPICPHRLCERVKVIEKDGTPPPTIGWKISGDTASHPLGHVPVMCSKAMYCTN